MFIGILGPNGSGKSTFLQVLGRSLKPKSGTILLNGNELDTLQYKDFAKIVGYVPQDNSIPFSYSVYDIVMMGRNPHLPRFKNPGTEDDTIVTDALRKTGVFHLAERSITSLSGGERQRVLIARVLAQDPDLLLLDEPFAHIDLHHQYELITLIRDTTRGEKSVISIFHDINLAAAYCDHLVLLNDGTIRAFGTPSEILTEDLLQEIFKISPLMGVHPIMGTPFLFVRNEISERSKQPEKVFLISGAGSGSSLMSVLVSAGFHVQCGVLSKQDTDYQVARKLGLDVISEPPFSRISLDHEEKLRELVIQADRVIVTYMPVGWGNFPNLKVLEHIPAHNIILYLPGENACIPDYTGGAATTLLNHLMETGAVRAKTIGEVAGLISQKIKDLNQK